MSNHQVIYKRTPRPSLATGGRQTLRGLGDLRAHVGAVRPKWGQPDPTSTPALPSLPLHHRVAYVNTWRLGLILLTHQTLICHVQIIIHAATAYLGTYERPTTNAHHEGRDNTTELSVEGPRSMYSESTRYSFPCIGDAFSSS